MKEKKQKAEAAAPSSRAIESLAADVKQYSRRLQKRDAKKRLIYVASLIFCIIVAALFIIQSRHSDKRSTNVKPDKSIVMRRDNTAGMKPVTLHTGTYTAGVDIKPGRYMVTPEKGDGYGSFVVYELGTNLPEISEVLGDFSETADIPCIAVTLAEKQKIDIEGAKLKGVTFTPLATKPLKELTTGIWVVGLDIMPGTYIVSSKDARIGSVTVFDGDLPVAELLVGKGGSMYKEYQTLTIKEGQVLHVADTPAVLFK